MKYWTSLYSIETYEAFSRSDRSVTGFRESQQKMAERVQPGDRFLAYLVHLSRWVGFAEVLEGPFIDRTPLLLPEDDPFVVRFKLLTCVWLELEHTIPIHDPEVFDRLSFTRDRISWTMRVRRSLFSLPPEDGEFLCELLRKQSEIKRVYPVDQAQLRRARKIPVKAERGVIPVTIPTETADDSEADTTSIADERESVRIQAALCRIGELMGFKIWLPVADRFRVLKHWQPQPGVLLERLPLNYDEATLGTIERIDVLWLKGRTIKRAFEVEHSTAIYSGLLRMADLCALVPNINIALHIVAPESRRTKVFEEITRPVFSLIEGAPLSQRCSFLPYHAVQEISELDYLAHTTDTILDEFVEHAE